MKGQTTWLSLKGAPIDMTLLKKMRYMLQLTEPLDIVADTTTTTTNFIEIQNTLVTHE